MNLTLERSVGLRGGMNNSAFAAADYGKQQAALMQNVRVGADGSAEVRAGTMRTSGAVIAAAQGYGVWPFGASWLAAVGTALFSTDQQLVVWTSRATGLTAAYWDAATMRVAGTDYLLLVNGTDAKSVNASLTVASISGIPAGVKYLAVAQRRLWAAGHAGPVVVASRIDDFGVWTIPDGLSIPVATDDAEENITALAPFRAALLVFKRRAIGLVEGFGETDVQTSVLSRSVGCVAFRTVRAIGDGSLAWLSERGIEVFNGQQITNVSQNLEVFFRDSVDWDAIFDAPGGPHAHYDPRKKEYRLYVVSPVTGEQYVVIYNDRLGCCYLWGPFAPNGGVEDDMFLTASAAGSTDVTDDTPHPTLVRGVGITDAGWPLIIDFGDTDASGTAVSGTVRTRIFDFGHPDRDKFGRIARATIVAPAGGTATARLYSDDVATGAVVQSKALASASGPQVLVSRHAGRGRHQQMQYVLPARSRLLSVTLEADVERGSVY